MPPAGQVRIYMHTISIGSSNRYGTNLFNGHILMEILKVDKSSGVPSVCLLTLEATQKHSALQEQYCYWKRPPYTAEIC